MAIFLTVLIAVGTVAVLIGLGILAEYIETQYDKGILVPIGVLVILAMILIAHYAIYPQIQSWLDKPAVVERVK